MIKNVKQNYNLCQSQLDNNQKFIEKDIKFFSTLNYQQCMKLLQKLSIQNYENVVKIYVTENKNNNKIVKYQQESNFFRVQFNNMFIQDVLLMFYDCLKGLSQLHELGIFHGNVKKENIGKRDNNIYFLILRKNQFKNSIKQSIIEQIQSFQLLNISPEVFENILYQKKFSYDEKDDLFQLGFTFLEVFEDLRAFQRFYDFEKKIFQYEIFQEYLYEIIGKITHYQAKSFLLFLTQYVLIKRSQRYSLKQSIQKVQQMINKKQQESSQIQDKMITQVKNSNELKKQQKNIMKDIKIINYKKTFNNNESSQSSYVQTPLYFHKRQHSNIDVSMHQKIVQQNKTNNNLSQNTSFQTLKSVKNKTIITPKKFLEQIRSQKLRQKIKLKALQLFQDLHRQQNEFKTVKKIYMQKRGT